jgi:uncharacterized tellurite resistance protein B-like protein
MWYDAHSIPEENNLKKACESPMLAFVRSLFRSAPESLSSPPVGPEAVPLAAAVLLLEAALMDESLEATEEKAILDILCQKFHCTRADAHALLQEADSHMDEKDHFYHYTKVLKDNLDDAGRIRIVEMLWNVVLADGEADDYETNLMRRISGLLYVSDRDSGEARKRVQERLSRESAPPLPASC